MENRTIIKRLPFAISKIHSYPLYAAIFGILDEFEYAREWCLANFFMIFSYYDKLNFYLDYSTLISDSSSWPKLDKCPYLKSEKISRKFIDDKYKTISDFIIESIDKGNYNYFFIDRHKIKYYNLDKEQHLDVSEHECLIYGYDMQKSNFYYSDFFQNFYQEKVIPFEEVNKAYCSFKRSTQYELYKYVYLLSIPENIGQIKISLDLEFFLNAISQYLTIDKNGAKIPIGTDIFWGIQVYDLFQNNISQELNGYNNVDIRNYYVLSEHKYIMTKFVEIVCKQYSLVFLDKSALEVYRLSTVIKNIIIKYISTRNKNLLNRVKSNLLEMRFIENRYLIKLKKYLDNYIC